ncbi:MAG: hypothetical protein COY40_00185 [Alphaproteobacteria bacterium CG_4_10_14_0_8_um_filter_53_9]|nr:MAG: hypothetical protein COY40_00185 [Alphaproteobacteria bacterium CG_4_10_14_0_8_um_filter_53_9]
MAVSSKHRELSPAKKAKRLASLNSQHAEADAALLAEQAQLLPDEAKIKRLKGKKLACKDEMARLGGTTTAAPGAGIVSPAAEAPAAKMSRRPNLRVVEGSARAEFSPHATKPSVAYTRAGG